MAKKIKKTPPSVDKNKQKLPPVMPLKPEPNPKSGSGTVEVPITELSVTNPGYMQRRVDVANLTQEQSHNLKRIIRGLEDKGATLKNGTQVRNASNAVKYMLENLSVNP